jgi:hypothetical protein
VLQPEAPSEIRLISAKVSFPWLVGRFPPARHSGAAKICFIPGQIMLYFTLIEMAGDNATRQMTPHGEVK